MVAMNGRLDVENPYGEWSAAATTQLSLMSVNTATVITGVRVRFHSTASRTVRPIIWRDDGGGAKTYIGTGPSVTQTFTANTTYHIPFSSPVTFPAGTTFYIGYYVSNNATYWNGSSGSYGPYNGVTMTGPQNMYYGGGDTGTSFPTSSSSSYALPIGLTAQFPPGVPGVPTVAPNPVNTNGTISWTAAVDPDGDSLLYYVQLSIDNGATWPYTISTGVNGLSTVYNFAAIPATTAAKVRVYAYDPNGGSSGWSTSAAFTIQHNVAPLAPTPTAPANNAILDRTAAQTFAATFNDPDAGDSSSRLEIQVRQGAGAWTNISQITTARSYIFAANYFAAGAWEWQWRYYDALGVVGPWSASQFFTAATPPAASTLTYPASGGVIATTSDAAVWSAPSQDSYQIRKVADNAGAPNTAVVYYDSGEVVSSTARNAPLDFPVNNRYEHIQVRIKVSGLWSSWSSVRVQVAYSPPAVAPVALTAEPDLGRVKVVITNPVPVGTEPAVVSNEIWRTVVGGYEGGLKRIAVVGPNATYYDYAAAGKGTLQYVVVAVGSTAVKTSSVPVTTVLNLRGIWLHDPADPTNTIHQFQWDGNDRSSMFEPEMALNEYVGRKFPVAEFGTGARESVRLPLPLDDENGDRDAFQRMMRRGAVLLYRDGRGRKAYCVLQSENMQDTVYGGKVDFAIYSVDYTEAV